MNKIIVIQTAFIGDAILATALLETLRLEHPTAEIDILVRKGNESLFTDHPFVNQVFVWNKKSKKYSNLFRVIRQLRKKKYDLLVNLQRFSSAGFMSFCSKSKIKIGFKGSLFSRFYSYSLRHEIGNGKHEIERNFDLLKTAPSSNQSNYQIINPKLYTDKVTLPEELNKLTRYYVLAPSSVWETKKMPQEKWIELISSLGNNAIYLLGGAGDRDALIALAKQSGIDVERVISTLTLLQSAKFISGSSRVYVNDSAPLHLASATNTPVTAFFCSTTPSFGFGPLSSDQEILQIEEQLKCRPCGLHGHKICPEGHFKCGFGINIEALGKASNNLV